MDSVSCTTSLFTTLIKQGAEAKVYSTNTYPSLPLYPPTTLTALTISLPTLPFITSPLPLLIKYRFPKLYRHPSLNTTLTKSRILAEVKCLLRGRKGGVNVPIVWFLDFLEGVIGMEFIGGGSFRDWLGVGEDYEISTEVEEVKVKRVERGEAEREELLRLMGKEIAKMHLVEIIHGDLTTSNIMLREAEIPSSLTKYEIVLIDFGLSTISSTPEDRAVDLYVLERAFASTHPVPLLPPSEEFPAGREGIPLFEKVLEGYREEMICLGGIGKGKKLEGNEWERVEKKLEEVRGRGRKRSMLG